MRKKRLVKERVLDGFRGRKTADLSEPTETAGYLPKAQRAIDRMKKSYNKGKGCRISWEELEEFNRSIIGDWFHQDDPIKGK